MRPAAHRGGTPALAESIAPAGFWLCSLATRFMALTSGPISGCMDLEYTCAWAVSS